MLSPSLSLSLSLLVSLQDPHSPTNLIVWVAITYERPTVGDAQHLPRFRLYTHLKHHVWQSGWDSTAIQLLHPHPMLPPSPRPTVRSMIGTP